MARWRVFASLTASAVALSAPATSFAQMELGPPVQRTYGEGLPRDRDLLIFDDEQYPVWPLTPEQSQYTNIDGARMKRHVIELAQTSLRYRDAGHQWWGRLPSTFADRESMSYMTRAFESLGLTVEHFPYELPSDWRATDWAASYRAADGSTTHLTTAFPVARTKATGIRGITAEAVWVGVGSEADFIGRNVEGKAVVIYSVFVPGGRSHSASNRAGLFNANTRAVEKGAAMVVNVMGVPGNGQFQPEGGIHQVPQFTLSMDEGFTLRDRLGLGERIELTFRLTVEELHDVETEYTIATLP